MGENWNVDRGLAGDTIYCLKAVFFYFLTGFILGVRGWGNASETSWRGGMCVQIFRKTVFKSFKLDMLYTVIRGIEQDAIG